MSTAADVQFLKLGAGVRHERPETGGGETDGFGGAVRRGVVEVAVGGEVDMLEGRVAPGGEEGGEGGVGAVVVGGKAELG